jgi:hypothetical protein
MYKRGMRWITWRAIFAYDKTSEAMTGIDQYRSISIDKHPAVIGRNIKHIPSSNHSRVNRC